jgi:GT2 family glycosyltransferase
LSTFDIVIPHYNTGRTNQLAFACVRSIQSCSEDYRIIWIQNGGAMPPAIISTLAQCERTLILCNQENLGFVKATNQGIQASDSPYIVLMNNDTRAASGWLDKLRKPLLNPEIGMSGPLSTAPGSWQGRIRPRCNPFILPQHINLAFFCVMIRRDVIEKVGLLDEGFGPGLGDDDDYSIRVRKAGYRLALAKDLVIPHNHRATFKELYSRETIRTMQQAAAKRIREKHEKFLEGDR